jgi:dTDP-4-dehydrorhamnose reductase
MRERKIYVTGSKGFVGSGFLNSFPDSSNCITPDIDELDITDEDALRKYFRGKKITTIINFAAMTDVNGAERERDDKKGLFWRVNVDGAVNLAKLALEKEASLIQISTDSVFPGQKDAPGPYSEDSKLPKKPEFMGWYGWTKKVAEEEIEKTGVDYALVRIAFPTGNFASPRDYLNKILSAINRGYPMFADQLITPTWIPDLEKVLDMIIDRKINGNFHVTMHPVTTPYDIASFMVDKLNLGEVKRGSVVDYLKNQIASRPVFGGLDSTRTQQLLGITFLTWQEAVNEFVRKAGV